MKRSDKKRIAKTIISGIGKFVKGATIKNPILKMSVNAVDGIVKGISNVKKENRNSIESGVGNLDIPTFIGSIVGLVIVLGGGIALIMGWLTMDQIESLFKLWEKTQ